MSMRIAKYPPEGGIGYDFHPASPPSLPPVPPAPPNPAPIPANLWVVFIVNPYGALLTGKYTKNCITEFQSDILVGHDWGPLQLHIPFSPAVLFASNIPALTLNSSHKYLLSSYSVQETPGGGALSLIGAGATPVAVTSESFVSILQDCQTNFSAPTGFASHLPTTRWVGFGVGDALSGLLMMLGDAATTWYSSTISSALMPKNDKFNFTGLLLGATNTAFANAANGVINGLLSDDVSANVSATDVVIAAAGILTALLSKEGRIVLSPSFISVLSSQVASIPPRVSDPS